MPHDRSPERPNGNSYGHAPLFLIRRLEEIFADHWDIPQYARKAIADAMVTIIIERTETGKEPKHDARTRIAAARTVLALHRQRLSDQLLERKLTQRRQLSAKQQRIRLSAIARELGIDRLAEQPGERNPENRDSSDL